jgi:hypothetical protein
MLMISLRTESSPMPEKYHETDSVYGIVRDIPLNYVERDRVDQKLTQNLKRDKHIVIYGSSKQGKTCLRKHCLDEEDYIVIQCGNRWTLEDVHSNILKRAGFKITQSEKKTVSGRNKIVASLKAGIPGLNSSLKSEMEDSRSNEITEKELELDPGDVNDVISALQSIEFSKYIVLEDFHYLQVGTQKDFAVALKAFHEVSELCFIVVGVWLEENRLIVHNGDLTGRVVSVDADEWRGDELRQVVEDGAALLNIQFDDHFITSIVEESYDSVYIVQETCRKACVDSGVTETQTDFQVIGENMDVREMVKDVVDQQTGRYVSFITQFADGFQETRLEMYKWILYPILTSSTSKLEDGFSYSDLRKSLQDNHPKGKELNLGNLTQSLQSTASLQVKKDIKPIILDYDQTSRRLSVVDRGFIIWMDHQESGNLLEMAGMSGAEPSA